MTFHEEILTNNQKNVLKKLGFLDKASCYLAGGTALALQLGHRTSLDFDFYTIKEFSSENFFNELKKNFRVIRKPKKFFDNTFFSEVYKVKISFFYYPYKLIKKTVKFRSIKLASLEDIAAMKVAAIIQRAKQRDFFDIYCLTKKMGLAKVIDSTFKKYPWYEEDAGLIFKALTYFDEADGDTEIQRVKIFDKNITWKIVKKEIASQVRSYIA